MQEIWPQLKHWVSDGIPFALATVVEASRPSPRGVGSVLAVQSDGDAFIGSVSAGCVESEVIEAAKACMADGEVRWLSFGPDSGFPWEVSLSCGGRIRVRIEPFAGLSDPDLGKQLSSLLDAQDRGLLISHNGRHFLLEHDEIWGTKRSVDSTGLIERAKEHYRRAEGTMEIEWEGSRALLRVLSRPKRLFVVGAAHIAIHLVGFAQSLGFETIVIDPRESYAREDRFPNPPDVLICEWPKHALEKYSITGSDCLAAMTHDPKIDDEALNVFLRSNSEYIGALGSRKSHAARLKRLGKLGFENDSFSRIHAPIGIDIGSETPAEIALSVMAQIVKKSHQKHSAIR